LRPRRSAAPAPGAARFAGTSATSIPSLRSRVVRVHPGRTHLRSPMSSRATDGRSGATHDSRRGGPRRLVRIDRDHHTVRGLRHH
jgi:hypothetical protein